MAEGVLYVVSDSEKGDERLVDANSRAQAIRHVSLGRFGAKPATPRDVARLMDAGIRVEDASGDASDPEPGK